ncbi:MAG: NB-ARC domain-containing protein, partial [Flavobacteriales bacterium]|nr:NB-ARC domain-containing protein [Flavobacteriales bacterium]
MNREDVNLFIASSSELADERKEFDAIVIKLGQSFDHLHLHVFKWEYNIPSGSYPGKGRIQDAINPHLNKSDIIIVLFYSRIGKFTREELNFGLSENKKIFLYFKTGFSPRTVQEGKDYSELLGLKQGVTEENKILFKEFKDHEDFSYILNEDISRYFRETYPFVQKADAKKEERENRSQFVGIHHYKLPKNFVGRITETEKIYNLLMETKTSSSISKIVSLIGVGGIGKSSLARYIVEKFVSNQKEFVYIIWYSFSSANSDDEGYLFRCITKYIQPHKYEIGQETQKESTYYVDLVKEILKTNKVLLILDNFETIQFLNDRKSAKFGSISKNYKLIKELFEFISDHAKSKILLTSRTNVIDLYDNAFHEE